MNIPYIKEITSETLKKIKIVPAEPIIYRALAGMAIDIQERTEATPKLWYGLKDYRTDPVTVEIFTTNKEIDDWQSLYGGGDQGAVGPRGYQGYQGPQGGSGAIGPQGSEGPRGYQGFQGFEGVQGRGMLYKGQVATVAQLEEITDAEVGDCYYVLETNSMYCYGE